jgi:putative pyruvate formate lyase activating enzyme
LESIDVMDGLVDIYLPDFKVMKNETSKRYLKTENYANVAKESILAMYRQVGNLRATRDGIAVTGVLVRHLVMPGHEDEGVEIVKWLAENVSQDLYIHIMEQYHPRAHVGKSKRSTKNSEPGSSTLQGASAMRYNEINRAVTDVEVLTVRKAAEAAGLHRFVEVSHYGGFS